MKKILITAIVFSASISVFAQYSDLAATVRAQWKVDQAELKANKKFDKALTDEVRADIKADQKVTDKS